MKDEIGVFASITTLFAEHNVSFEKILQLPIKGKDSAEIVLVTHRASLQDFEDILNQLRDNELVYDIKSTYRVEGEEA